MEDIDLETILQRVERQLLHVARLKVKALKDLDQQLRADLEIEEKKIAEHFAKKN